MSSYDDKVPDKESPDLKYNTEAASKQTITSNNTQKPADEDSSVVEGKSNGFTLQ